MLSLILSLLLLADPVVFYSSDPGQSLPRMVTAVKLEASRAKAVNKELFVEMPELSSGLEIRRFILALDGIQCGIYVDMSKVKYRSYVAIQDLDTVCGLHGKRKLIVRFVEHEGLSEEKAYFERECNRRAVELIKELKHCTVVKQTTDRIKP